MIQRTSDPTQGAIARLARAADPDELLEPFVFIVLFGIRDMEADGPSAGVVIRSLHSCVMQVAVARLSA